MTIANPSADQKRKADGFSLLHSEELLHHESMNAILLNFIPTIYQTEDGNFCAGLPLSDFGCISSDDRLTRTGTRSVLSAIQFS